MRFCAVFLILLVGIGLIGCRDRSATRTADPPREQPLDTVQVTSSTSEPLVILDRMVTAYQTAVSYSDRATVQIVGKMSQPGTKPVPWNCLVAFQKPNRFRLDINDGIFFSDGEYCYAQIWQLPDQVLHFPSPAQWTLETLFQDVHLDAAMELGLPRTVLRFPPQLILLLANNPLNTFCPKGSKIEWVGQRSIDQIRCDVVQISHSDGNRILWIGRENGILLRLDYQPVGLPVPEGYESIEAIRIEMTDARFDWNFVPTTFQMFQPQGAVQVAEFQSDAPGLPTTEEHRCRLKLMTDSDTYRRIAQPESATPSPQPPSKSAPKMFTLVPVWSQPLIGVDTMALLPDETSKLLVPYEGNFAAVLDLQGNVLQKVVPKELEDSIVMDVQAIKYLSGKQRIGISTLDGKFYGFDGSFKPSTVHNVEPDETKKETIRDFCFIQHQEDELLLLGIQQNPVQNDAVVKSAIRAVDFGGTKLWEYPFEGVLNQIASAIVEDQIRLFVSSTVSQDQDAILMLSLDGTAFDPISFDFGRHILWFQVLNPTIYTLVLNTNGDVRFVGFGMDGKAKWSRLLPTGEYDVEPVYVPKEKKWLVPSPSGEIFVFDLIGNLIDTFSLDVVPTGLFCVEVNGETLLIVADGKTVSAWQVRPRTNF